MEIPSARPARRYDNPFSSTAATASRRTSSDGGGVPPCPGGRDGTRWARRPASQASTSAGSDERGPYDHRDQIFMAASRPCLGSGPRQYSAELLGKELRQVWAPGLPAGSLTNRPPARIARVPGIRTCMTGRRRPMARRYWRTISAQVETSGPPMSGTRPDGGPRARSTSVGDFDGIDRLARKSLGARTIGNLAVLWPRSGQSRRTGWTAAGSMAGPSQPPAAQPRVSS